MCIKFKARCSLQCPSAALVLMSFWNVLPPLAPGLLLASVCTSVSWHVLRRSLLLCWWRFWGPCCFSTTSVYTPDSMDPRLTSWFRPLCWCRPVMWPSSVSSKYCWFKLQSLPVSNHVPSSKLKPESNSIFSSGLTVKSLWQSLLWLYFSIVHALDHVLATAGAAEKWLPEKQNWLMKNALLRSRNTLNRKLLCLPMWTK